GLGWDELETLATGTLLHDLGKIFVPAEILNKPGALTPEEFGVVKDHCQRGYALLKDQISPLAAHIAFQHHERCNGSGYPRGLDASGTITFAKLTAVADSFDAMTSNRVYRRAMLPERAAAILLQETPAKYEPEFVKTLAKLVAPYPIGCRVLLDTGERGDVASATRTQTFVALVDGPRAGEIVVCPDEAAIISAEEW
ncbi:MAG: HD-GYP domain-containing protein, partial [Methanocella sp.]